MVEMMQSRELRGKQLVIYRRNNSPYWQVRIKLECEPYIYQSLKVKDAAEAKIAAEDILGELLYRRNNDLALKPVTFRQLGKLFLAKMEEDRSAGRCSKERLGSFRTSINRYFTPHFGNKKIDEIKEADIFKYQAWRDQYWLTGEGSRQKEITYERKNGRTGEREFVTRPIKKNKKLAPSTTTLRTESSYLRTIYEFARRSGYIQGHQIPEIKSPKIQINRRPHFDRYEYDKLLVVSRRRIRNATNPRVRLERRNMHDWILIMANTGMRPTEAKSLKWQDIDYKTTDDDEKIVVLSVWGKNKSRDLVAMPKTKDYVERLRRRSPHTAPDDHVFLNYAGDPIKSYINGFNALLKEAGLLCDNEGKKRAPYSLRHTYATFALLQGRVNVFTLAMNMGTSVDMIEKHYGHVKPLQAYKELTARYKI